MRSSLSEIMKIGNFLFSASSLDHDHTELDIPIKDDGDEFSKMVYYFSLNLATGNFVEKVFNFSKNNAPVVFLFDLHTLAKKCTKIYNAYRAIVLHIKTLVLGHFRYRCGLYKLPAFVAYKGWFSLEQKHKHKHKNKLA